MWCKRYKKEIEYLQELYVSEHHKTEMFKKAYEEALDTIRKLRESKKRKKPLTHKSGYRMTTKEERKEMYQLWLNGMDLIDIAKHFSRSPSTISRYVRKFYEENNNGEQMGRLHQSENRTLKEKE